MSFQPYHRFQNRLRLERVITNLFDEGQVPDNIFENFERYHRAMIHKLRSAKYNLDNLEEKLTTTNIEDAADITSDFSFEVNMFIDGFFYTAGSAMDILARVVLNLFGLPLSGRIYFETAHTNITQSRPSDPILTRLGRPNWKQQFSEFRNTLTHELIIASLIHIELDTSRVSNRPRIVLPLPDDPRARPNERTYRRNYNVLSYTSQQFSRILRLSNTIYGDIADRVESARQLPI